MCPLPSRGMAATAAAADAEDLRVAIRREGEWDAVRIQGG
jgi:hypothetical protein